MRGVTRVWQRKERSDDRLGGGDLWRLRMKKKTQPETRRRKAAIPMTMPAMAAGVSLPLSDWLASWISVSLKTLSLRPRRLPGDGWLSQPVLIATRTICRFG